MASKRSRKKLNSKQANRISLIISMLYFIYMFVSGIISKPTGDQAMYYWFIGCIVGTVFIYFVFYFLVFKGEDKKRKEEEKIKATTMQYLSHTDFRQVCFLAKGFGGDIDMMKQILQNEGCKFYAKLTENNNIYLIVKDKYNEEVYNAEIWNHIYFNSNFKIEK